jgi:hypothetical protein
VYDATSSDPISHRTLRNVCVKSARYCTNEITADSTMCSVTPPSSSTSADVPRRRAFDSP